jgi:glycosyltransferase involved in cell wall biosynthesis
VNNHNHRWRIGILDHTGQAIGGAQLVACQAASVLSRHYDVEIIHTWEVALDSLAKAFRLDLSRVRERRVPYATNSFSIPGPASFVGQIRANGRNLSAPYDLFIYSGHGVPPFCHARHGLAYCHFPIEASPTEELGEDERWRRRNASDRWMRSRAYQALWKLRMKGYEKILANSAFTADWVARRWGCRAEVLYPPVNMASPQVLKRNLIVSLGRFGGGLHNKNQLAQIAAFREFLARASEDWSLCLIGFCGESAGDQEYLRAVQLAAEGLPVSFLVNGTRAAVEKTLASAKLFWHTTGAGIDAAARPQEMEHFGIATVEAMRAGCVSVVIDSGGQREIVENSVSGFLCNDMSELLESSILLTRQPSLLSGMAKQAKQRSMDFSPEKFDQRLLNRVSQCLDS